MTQRRNTQLKKALVGALMLAAASFATSRAAVEAVAAELLRQLDLLPLVAARHQDRPGSPGRASGCR